MTKHLTAIEAYRRGYRASARTTTYDLEAAERRFVRRYGSEHHDAFVAGWVDHAADNGFQPEAHGFGAPAEAPAEEAPAAPVVVDAEPDHDGYNPFHLRPAAVVAIKGRPILWTDDLEEASRARAERPGAVIYAPQEDPDLAFHELVDRDPGGHQAWLAGRGSSHDTEGSLDGVLFDGHLIEEDDEGVRLTTPAGDVHVVAGPSDVPADVPAHVAALVRSIVEEAVEA